MEHVGFFLSVVIALTIEFICILSLSGKQMEVQSSLYIKTTHGNLQMWLL